MRSTTTEPEDTGGHSVGRSWHRTVIRLAVGLLAVVVSVQTAMSLVSGASRALLVLPVAAAFAAGLAVLAFTRFEYFVIGLLVVRASADAGKLSEGGSGLMDPSSALAMLFLLAGMFWIAARRRSDGAAPPSPLGTALTLFLVAAGLSALGSSHLGASALDWLRMAAAAAMFFVLNRLVSDGRHVRLVVGATFASAVVPLLVGFAGIAYGGLAESKGGFDRITSTFSQSNGYSRYLMLLIVFGVAVRRHLTGGYRLALSCVLVGSAASLVLTYTRSAWLATVVGLVVVGFLQNKGIVVGLVVVGVATLLAVPSVAGRFSDLSEESTTSDASANSLSWRLGYWAEILPLANDNPVTGIGLKATEFETDEAKLPHNDFLRAYVETGILGLIAYLGLLGAMVRTARRALRRARPGFERGVAVGFAGFVASWIGVSLVANAMAQVVLLWYLLAIAACAQAIARGLPETPESPESSELSELGAPR